MTIQHCLGLAVEEPLLVQPALPIESHLLLLLLLLQVMILLHVLPLAQEGLNRLLLGTTRGDK